MRILRIGALALGLLLAAGVPADEAMNREQALAATRQADAARRLAGVQRLGEIGAMPDAPRLQASLSDSHPAVREAAAAALWQLWSRSGDAATDALFARGLAQMQARALADALATFSEIVRRQPDFAEGWNKRATVYFLLGRPAASLADCDEVFKRNASHFGALSGAGQIHLQLGHLEQALGFFQRALAANPNLLEVRHLIPMIQRQLREQHRHST